MNCATLQFGKLPLVLPRCRVVWWGTAQPPEAGRLDQSLLCQSHVAWTRDLISLCLSFFTSKMEMKIVPTTQSCYEDSVNKHF